jgi:hypothetical protein
MRIARFLHNPKVTLAEMIATARSRAFVQASGRHALAIQDTSSLRVGEKGAGLFIHPVIAVDAEKGTVFGLIDNFFLKRQGGAREARKQRTFEEKDSRRWLLGAQSASALLEAGATCVTVIEDREGDVYECFAYKPARVEKLVRAAQDRRLADGTSLFSKVDGWKEAGRMSLPLAAAPGRAARKAELSIRFGAVEILRPTHRTGGEGLPECVAVNLVIAREINPPNGEEPALWLLLTTHEVDNLEKARRIIGFYRSRWTIEQLFRTMKTKGFDVEALRQEPDGPLEKLVTAILIAAIQVMQLVAEREGQAKRPLSDVFDPDDQPTLERVCQSLEGKTAKQKNPYLKGSLAYAAWVFARLGGWTGYYGKPGPIVILRGVAEFSAIKRASALLNV